MNVPRLINDAEAELLNSQWVVENASAYAMLFDLGIYGRAVTGRGPLDALAVDRVCKMPGGSFEFARNLADQAGHVEALIVPARDEFGNMDDLVALHLPSGRLRTWRGRAAMLGADNLFTPRGLEPLDVHETPLAWLREARRGVYIIDPKRAAPSLKEAEPLAVRSIAFGRDLERRLTIPAPRIMVASHQRRIAA